MKNKRDFEEAVDLICQSIEAGTNMDIINLMIMVQIKLAYMDGLLEMAKIDVRDQKLQ